MLISYSHSTYRVLRRNVPLSWTHSKISMRPKRFSAEITNCIYTVRENVVKYYNCEFAVEIRGKGYNTRSWIRDVVQVKYFAVSSRVVNCIFLSTQESHYKQLRDNVYDFMRPRPNARFNIFIRVEEKIEFQILMMMILTSVIKNSVKFHWKILIFKFRPRCWKLEKI